MTWPAVVLSLLGGLALLWLGLIVALLIAARRAGDRTRLVDLLRLVPYVVRLLRRLVADPSLPRPVRVWLGVLLVYLLLPIDLIPDVVPVVGYLDDAIVVALVLRYVTRRAGAAALDRHWPGSPQGLAALRALTGVS